jgi:hypothetical protein
VRRPAVDGVDSVPTAAAALNWLAALATD